MTSAETRLFRSISLQNTLLSRERLGLSKNAKGYNVGNSLVGKQEMCYANFLFYSCFGKVHFKQLIDFRRTPLSISKGSVKWCLDINFSISRAKRTHSPSIVSLVCQFVHSNYETSICKGYNKGRLCAAILLFALVQTSIKRH